MCTGDSFHFRLTNGRSWERVEVWSHTMSRIWGEYNTQPSDSCQLLYHLSYLCQTFTIPYFVILQLQVLPYSAGFSFDSVMYQVAKSLPYIYEWNSNILLMFLWLLPLTVLLLYKLILTQLNILMDFSPEYIANIPPKSFPYFSVNCVLCCAASGQSTNPRTR